FAKKLPLRPLSPRRRHLARLRPRLVLPNSSDGSARVVGSQAGRRRRLGSAARAGRISFPPKVWSQFTVGTEGGGDDARSTQCGSGAQGRCGVDAEGAAASMPKAPVQKDAAATPPRIRDSLREGRSKTVLARDRYISASVGNSSMRSCNIR
ncbi:unnamed protein product, partial [Urochloa humidicola]